MNSVKLFLILSIFTLATYVLNGEKAGARVAIKQDVISEIQKKFLPKVFDELRSITVPDQTLTVDIKIGTIYIYLTNVRAGLSHLFSENVKLTFLEPNKINIQISQIAGT